MESPLSPLGSARLHSPHEFLGEERLKTPGLRLYVLIFMDPST